MKTEAKDAPSCRNCTKYKACMDRSRDIPCSVYSTNKPRMDKVREQIEMLNRLVKGDVDAVRIPL